LLLCLCLCLRLRLCLCLCLCLCLTRDMDLARRTRHVQGLVGDGASRRLPTQRQACVDGTRARTRTHTCTCRSDRGGARRQRRHAGTGKRRGSSQL